MAKQMPAFKSPPILITLNNPVPEMLVSPWGVLRNPHPFHRKHEHNSRIHGESIAMDVRIFEAYQAGAAKSVRLRKRAQEPDPSG